MGLCCRLQSINSLMNFGFKFRQGSSFDFCQGIIKINSQVTKLFISAWNITCLKPHMNNLLIIDFHTKGMYNFDLFNENHLVVEVSVDGMNDCS